jgi:hypothetical protein
VGSLRLSCKDRTSILSSSTAFVGSLYRISRSEILVALLTFALFAMAATGLWCPYSRVSRINPRVSLILKRVDRSMSRLLVLVVFLDSEFFDEDSLEPRKISPDVPGNGCHPASGIASHVLSKHKCNDTFVSVVSTLLQTRLERQVESLMIRAKVLGKTATDRIRESFLKALVCCARSQQCTSRSNEK